MWRRIRYNATYTIVSLAIVAVAGFATMYFNARSLGVDGLSSYAALLALVLMLELLAGFECWQAVVALAERSQQRVFGAALVVNGASVVVATAIGMAMVYVLDLGGGWAAYALMATLLLRMPDPAIGILRRQDQYAYIAWARAGIALISLAMAATLWAIDAPLAWYLVGSGLIQIGFTAALMLAAMRFCRPAKPTADDFWAFVRFAIPSGLAGAIGAVRGRGMLVLLALLGGPGSVGLFAVADRIASIIRMGTVSLYEIVFREIAGVERPFAFMGIIGAGGLVVGVAAIVFAVILGEWLIIFVAGPDFALAAPAFTIMVAVMGLQLAMSGVRAGLIVKVGPKTILGSNALGTLAFAAAPYLMSAYGPLGAAYAQLIYEFLWVAGMLGSLIAHRKRFASS